MEEERDIFYLFKESLKNKNSWIPNLLTASRLVGAFVVPGLFLSGNILGAIIAVGAFATTDFLDGRIARKYNGFSEFGRILDPIADKAFAIIPSLAILPSAPILGLNIAAEAIIGFINARSYTKNGNPKSSLLGKIKTFCLFPAVGLCYVNAALHLPITAVLTTIFCTATLAVQGLTARDYYKKAKAETQKANPNTKNEEVMEISTDKDKQLDNQKTVSNTISPSRTRQEEIQFLKEEREKLLPKINTEKEKVYKKKMN